MDIINFPLKGKSYSDKFLFVYTSSHRKPAVLTLIQQNSQYQPHRSIPNNTFGSHGPQSYASIQSPPYPPTGARAHSQGSYSRRGSFYGSQRGSMTPHSGFQDSLRSAQWSPSNSVLNSGQASPRSEGPTNANSRPHSRAQETDIASETEFRNEIKPGLQNLEFSGVENFQNDGMGGNEDKAPPTGPRHPPTAPQGPKFSFAFKTSTKPSVVTPKSEISQKFNAVSQRRESYSESRELENDRGGRYGSERFRDREREKDSHRNRERERDHGHRGRDRERERDRRDRDRHDKGREWNSRRDRMARDRDTHDHDQERLPPRGPARDHRPAPRDPPKDAPREPASSRGRHDASRLESRPPKGPSVAASVPSRPSVSQTRRVKKIERTLLPKPNLPHELAKADSVFHRKPGNESVIGSGTYGKVFKGKHAYTGRLVALKRIRMESEKDGFPVTAVREIKLLQSLKHINIVNLQEVMVERNDCFMVFEYLSHDLTGLLNHPTFTLEPAHRKDLAKQLFEGLDYLHFRGVLHRDIKAANILVSNDGVLKLADFGLARFFLKRHQLDYTNRVVTVWYRSPELLLGETQYGPAVDIWSAACVLCEIYLRNAIFPGNGSEVDQLDKIYNILGTPTLENWPSMRSLPWHELIQPDYRRPNRFASCFQDKFTSACLELLEWLFQYDPVKRPTAKEVLAHRYFEEEPQPRRAIE